MLTEFVMTLLVFRFYATRTTSQAQRLSLEVHRSIIFLPCFTVAIFTCSPKKEPTLGVLSHVAAQAAQGVVCSPASLDSWCDSASAGEDGLRTKVTQPTTEAEWKMSKVWIANMLCPLMFRGWRWYSWAFIQVLQHFQKINTVVVVVLV